MNRAMAEASACDICFSIGTSSLVQPAASLPFVALNAGALVVEINPTPTSLSSKAHFSLQATAADALTAIVADLAYYNGSPDNPAKPSGSLRPVVNLSPAIITTSNIPTG